VIQVKHFFQMMFVLFLRVTSMCPTPAMDQFELAALKTGCNASVLLSGSANEVFVYGTRLVGPPYPQTTYGRGHAWVCNNPVECSAFFVEDDGPTYRHMEHKTTYTNGSHVMHMWWSCDPSTNSECVVESVGTYHASEICVFARAACTQ